LKIAFITGATSGIGKASAELFAKSSYNLILCARREADLDKIAEEILKKSNIQVLTIPLDVRERESVEKAIKNLPFEWQGIDVLINNAGLARGFDLFPDANVDDWDEMIDTNVKGLLYVSKSILPYMIEKGNGQIINIGSVAGRETYPKGHVYCASKAAVKSISDGMRMDLYNTDIKIANIEPGLVETNFSKVRFHGDSNKADSVYKGVKALTALDIAETALWIAERPAHVAVNEVYITPTRQGSATLVDRS
jgi:3-hydroxy acid dehydrogenase / malonic semialdehyde reductase